MGYPLTDALGVSVILEVLVICVNCDRMGRPSEEVAPIGKAPNHSQELTVMDVIVAFCFSEGF